jgi:hypothetical protein
MKSTKYSLIAAVLVTAAGCDPKPTPIAKKAPPPTVSQAPSDPSQVDPNKEMVKADVGVGERGRDCGGGLVTEPVKQYWGLREQITFDIKLPQAMRHYKALHDDMPPQTQEEFDKEIIAASGIQLPKLPDGQRYLYDPKTGELLVERPRRPGDK